VLQWALWWVGVCNSGWYWLNASIFLGGGGDQVEKYNNYPQSSDCCQGSCDQTVSVHLEGPATE